MASNLLSAPEAFRAAWEWVVALDAYDYGDRRPLADLIGRDEIPADLRKIIACIIAGDRKPNLKAAAKLKVPAAERMRIAGSLSVVLDLGDRLRVGRDPEGLRHLDRGADRFGQEAIDAVRWIENESRQAVDDTATQLGVSVETIENLLRELRKKIEKYPNI